MPAPRPRDIPTVHDPLSAGKWRTLTGRKTHDSVGKSSQCWDVKLAAGRRFLGDRVLSPKPSESASGWKEETGKGGGKERACHCVQDSILLHVAAAMSEDGRASCSLLQGGHFALCGQSQRGTSGQMSLGIS